MITTKNGQLCFIPDDKGIKFMTRPEDRSKDRNAVIVSWENLDDFIRILQKLNIEKAGKL